MRLKSMRAKQPDVDKSCVSYSDNSKVKTLFEAAINSTSQSFTDFSDHSFRQTFKKTSAALHLGEPDSKQWTEEQEAIYAHQDGNLCVQAFAGCGKTTTAIEKARRLNKDGKKVLYVAFNKTVQTEVEGKAKGCCEAKTYHSLGMMCIRNMYGNIGINERAGWPVIEGMRTWRPVERPLKMAVKKLVGLAKQYGVESKEELSWLIDFHGIDCNGEPTENYGGTTPGLGHGTKNEEIVVQWAQNALQATLRSMLGKVERGDRVEVDFDDQIWLPHKLQLKVPGHYDYAIVDEAQDTNKVQQYLATSAAPQTMIVGDRWQAIYSWRGASTEAMKELTETLCASTLPLSLTHRCPVKVVELANKLGVKIRALPSAPDGQVNQNIYPHQFIDKAEQSDMVLCRVNAPLISTAYKFISQGKPAYIKGRDIGEGLVRFVEQVDQKFEPKTIREFIQFAEKQIRNDVQKLLALGEGKGEARATNLMDKLSCLIAASEGCATTGEVSEKVKKLFDQGNGGVVFGTVHRMKGSESARVWVLKPELMPHPNAKREHEVQGEMNVLYVAITRAKSELNFVGEMPQCLR